MYLCVRINSKSLTIGLGKPPCELMLDPFTKPLAMGTMTSSSPGLQMMSSINGLN